MQTGKAQLKSAGPLAFGPDGVLFVGDSAGAAIVALDVNDRTPAKSADGLEIKGINEKVAAMFWHGSRPDRHQRRCGESNLEKRLPFGHPRQGAGRDAGDLESRHTGKISEVSLDNIKHAVVSLPDAPVVAADNPRSASRRMETITAIAYVKGNVIVAGLSNEEFSSALRSIPYPFEQVSKGAGIEIWHGSHGQFETNAPVRTFVPYEINNQSNILAAYTCTPLVKIPVSELKAGAKVKGTTIAELGNRDNLETFTPITKQTEVTGVPYETIATLQGVQQLSKFDDAKALVLMGSGPLLDLRTVPLP